MAEIDFSAGYRDATRGSTLKALQARRAQMQTQIEQAMKPEPIASMWQGAAHVGGVIGSSIREARVANQEAAGRERFAKLLAGGLTPDEIGEAMNLDPDITMKYQQHEWDSQAKRDEQDNLRKMKLMEHGWSVDDAERRIQADKDRQEASFTHADTAQQAGFTHADTAQQAGFTHEEEVDTRELDQTKDKELRDAEAAKVAADEAAGRTSAQSTQTAAQSDPAARVQLAVEGGYLTPEEGKVRIDAINAEAAKKTIPAGLDQLNRDTAKEALDWKTVGQSTMASNQVNVAEAIKILETPGVMGDVGDRIGLGKTGALAGVLPEGLQAVMNPSGIKARDSIRTAVQSSLKHVLGSQFAATEGEQMLNRAFNMSVNPKDNANRARLIMAQLQQSAAAKDQFVKYYFDNNYNMNGYQGPTLEQIQADFKEKTDAIINTSSDGAEAPAAAAPDISTLSDEDLRRIAGGAP